MPTPSSRSRQILRLLAFTFSFTSMLGVAGCAWWNVDYLDSSDASETADANSPDVDEGGDVGEGPDGTTSDDGMSPADASSSKDGSTPTPDADAGAPILGSDGGDLILNASCETGATGWTTVNATPIEASTAFVRPGEQDSCRSYGRLRSGDGPLQEIAGAVVPRHQYTTSAWVLWAPPGDAGPGADAGTQSVNITVKQTCGSSTAFLGLGSATNIAEGQWTQIQSEPGMFTAPTGCQPLLLQYYITGPSAGLDLYVADVSLVLYK